MNRGHTSGAVDLDGWHLDTALRGCEAAQR